MDSIESRILEVLSGEKGSLKIRDIADKCGMSPHTVTRRLDTLELLGRIRKIQMGNAKRYYLADSLPVSSLIDVSSDLILVVDETWKVQYINTSAQKNLGLIGKQIIGERLDFLNLDIFSSPPVLEGLRSFTLEKVCRIEVMHERENEQLWYSVSLMSQCHSPGNMTITITAENVTSRVQARKCQDLMISVLQLLNTRDQASNEIINHILQAIRKSCALETVGIRLHREQGYPYYKTDGFTPTFIAEAGQLCNGGYPGNSDQNVLIKSGPSPRDMHTATPQSVSLFFSGGDSFWSGSTSTFCSSQDTGTYPVDFLVKCCKEGYESVAVIPIRSHGGVIGLLELCDIRKYCFTPDMIEFFEGLSNTIGLALERKKMEHDIRESERTYRMLADNVQDVIWTMDLHGTFTYVSPSILQMRGYTVDEALRMPLNEVVHPESLSQVMDLIQKNMSKAKDGYDCTETFEVRQSHNNGSWIWTEVTARFLPDSTGNPVEIIGISRDISRRKKMEEELSDYRSNLESIVMDRTMSLNREIDVRKMTEASLRKSEKLLTGIINFAPDATFAIDSKGMIIAWNYAMEDLTGYPASEMIGKGREVYSLVAYGFTRPLLIDLILDDEALCYSYYDEVRRDGFVLTAISTSAIIKGEKKRMWIKASPLYDDHLQLIGAIESIRVLEGM